MLVLLRVAAVAVEAVAVEAAAVEAAAVEAVVVEAVVAFSDRGNHENCYLNRFDRNLTTKHSEHGLGSTAFEKGR